MFLKVNHGYFIFRESKTGQVSDFMNRTGLKLVARDDYYTFEKLVDAPDYSLNGKLFLGYKATKTFEGTPWGVFEANQVIYDFNSGELKLISLVTNTTVLRPAGNRFFAPGLIMPGSLTEGGKRVRDYAAWYSRESQSWLYSEVTFV